MSSEKDALERLETLGRALEKEVNQLRIRLDRLEQRECVKWPEMYELIATTFDSSKEEILAWITERITGRRARLHDAICPHCMTPGHTDAGPYCGNCGAKLPV